MAITIDPVSWRGRVVKMDVDKSSLLILDDEVEEQEKCFDLVVRNCNIGPTKSPQKRITSTLA